MTLDVRQPRVADPSERCRVCSGYGEIDTCDRWEIVATCRACGGTGRSPTQVRGVSGYGPRCGCGGKSTLHIRKAREVTPETSVFLCRNCVEQAVELLRARRPEQPPYWPADEDRDERYQPPGGPMTTKSGSDLDDAMAVFRRAADRERRERYRAEDEARRLREANEILCEALEQIARRSPVERNPDGDEQAAASMQLIAASALDLLTNRTPDA